jgi:hypothetical protein
MPYISDELTHFVGRSLPDDNDRLDPLCRIIRSGELFDPSHINRRDRIFAAGLVDKETGAMDSVEYSSSPNVRHDLTSSLSANQLVQFEIVCFCDIPMAHLAIHRAKYGSFGLAFTKLFLLKQGAAPVMYVPRSGLFAMTLREHHVPDETLNYEEAKAGRRDLLFDELFEMHNCLGLPRYKQLETQLFSSTDHDHIDKVVKELRTMLLYQTAVEANIFGHLKFYDPTLPEDHPDNYYMEREWRVSGHVRFNVGDIAHVLVPGAFLKQMASEFPELGGCVTPL